MQLAEALAKGDLSVLKNNSHRLERHEMSTSRNDMQLSLHTLHASLLVLISCGC